MNTISSFSKISSYIPDLAMWHCYLPCPYVKNLKTGGTTPHPSPLPAISSLFYLQFL